MNNVLIVEDNRMVGSLLREFIGDSLDLNVILLETLQATKALLENDPPDFLVALLDINLPDAPDGKVVDFVIQQGIPVIVFTAGQDDSWHDKFWAKQIVAYVLKEGPDALPYLTFLIQSLQKNRNTKVLVVDDSISSREYLLDLFRVQRFIAFAASNGQAALEILDRQNDIKLIVTDYHMPDMNGDELTRAIRQKHNINELAIIGISSVDDRKISSLFLKAGANDFLNKPFFTEEFYCRVSQNIQTLEYIETIKDISNRDYLTSLYNRRYFFEAALRFYDLFKRQGNPFAVAIIDLDHFKKVNDTYGHNAGDLVLKYVAGLMQHRFRSADIICRFGGEEFSVFLTDVKKKEACRILNDLMLELEKSAIEVGENRVKITMSIGVCTNLQGSLDEMIKKADLLLYQAKEEGRNKLVCD
ncbi:MAG: diguanylate cyclase [Proteobacteria bacterium]|nr:diguanylate cyclase [Pseudomonadota bacterium]MBU1714692.1 diguanylate cyclase [Pseudomonadota bacterium]